MQQGKDRQYVKTCLVVFLLFCSSVTVHFPLSTQPFLNSYFMLISPCSNRHSQNGSVAGAHRLRNDSLGFECHLAAMCPWASRASQSLCFFFYKMELDVAAAPLVGEQRPCGRALGLWKCSQCKAFKQQQRVPSPGAVFRNQGSQGPKVCQGLCSFSHLSGRRLSKYIRLLLVFDQSSLAMIVGMWHSLWGWFSWAGPQLTRAAFEENTEDGLEVQIPKRKREGYPTAVKATVVFSI